MECPPFPDINHLTMLYFSMSYLKKDIIEDKRFPIISSQGKNHFMMI